MVGLSTRRDSREGGANSPAPAMVVPAVAPDPAYVHHWQRAPVHRVVGKGAGPARRARRGRDEADQHRLRLGPFVPVSRPIPATASLATGEQCGFVKMGSTATNFGARAILRRPRRGAVVNLSIFHGDSIMTHCRRVPSLYPV